MDVTLLRPREQALLEFLMGRPGQIVSVETLLEEVWGNHLTHRDTSTVKSHICTLRKKLAENQRIETSRGLGYCWIPLAIPVSAAS